jgi:hypothetical protein
LLFCWDEADLVMSCFFVHDRYLLTPDTVHAMYISDFFKLYPDAKCIGPEGIAQKKPDVKWAGVFGEGGESKTHGFDEVSREPVS